MTKNILICILLLIFNVCYGQNNTLKYKQLDKTDSYSTLLLLPKDTFIYENTESKSCRSWYDLGGKWKRNNDKITISYPIKWSFSEGDIFAKNYAVFILKDENNNPLPNVEICFYQSSKNKLSILTDEKGKAIINFNKESINIYIYFKTNMLKVKVKKSENHIEIIEKNTKNKEFLISKSTAKENFATEGTFIVNVNFLMKNDMLYYQNIIYEGYNPYKFKNLRWNNFKKYIGEETNLKTKK